MSRKSRENRKMVVSTLGLLLLAGSVAGFPQEPASDLPHIVLILADDMGYGDPGCYNPDSKVPTPSLDRLAAEGMRFTDAHAPASVCVPSRYGLMTGRFPFRASLEWRERAVIEPGRMTVAALLRESGYATSMIGKWHLGFDNGPDYDFSLALQGGPLDRGFGTYFGIPHSLDIVPYYLIRGRKAIQAPTGWVEASSSEGWSPIQGAFWRAGPMAPDFRHDEILSRLSEEAVEVVRSHGDRDPRRPLFLYLALTAPHTPWLPGPDFRGRTGAGSYGDFVAQVDHLVGRIIGALDRAGMSGNTLLIFTSDNGPVWYDRDVDRFGHDSAGSLRGMKGDSWEAGHRVPFLVRWPGRVAPSTESRYLLSFTDLLATFAELAGRRLPGDAGEDSISALPAFLGKSSERPEAHALVLKEDATVVRKGPWKLIGHLGSGGFSEPRRVSPVENGPRGQLYNLENDPGESRNLWLDRPDKVRELTGVLREYRERKRSRP